VDIKASNLFLAEQVALDNSLNLISHPLSPSTIFDAVLAYTYLNGHKETGWSCRMSQMLVRSLAHRTSRPHGEKSERDARDPLIASTCLDD
jgi:hypothetical protein